MILKQAAEKMVRNGASLEYSGWFQHHGNFNASGKYRTEEMLLICPAESGLTKGPGRSGPAGWKMGISCVCTVQSKDSVLADYCDVTIVKLSGKERNLPSAKGYSIGLLILLLCLMDSAKSQKASFAGRRIKS